MEDETIIYKIEILQLIERFYNIKIHDDEVENIITFKDLISMVKQKIEIY